MEGLGGDLSPDGILIVLFTMAYPQELMMRKNLPICSPGLCRHWLSALLLTVHLPVAALTFDLPREGNDLVGKLYRVKATAGQTLVDIAEQHGLGFNEVKSANPGLDPWLIRTGQEVLIPARFILPPGPREGIVINLAEYRLYYYPRAAEQVMTYPIGIGRAGWDTPTGTSRVRGKAKDPWWRVPESVKRERLERGEKMPDFIPPGKDNPIGRHALTLDMPGYLLHGTNKNFGVGTRISHGCIRLYPKDIETLFNLVPEGTPVTIVNTPSKAGWWDNELYLEVQELTGPDKNQTTNLTPVIQAIVEARKGRQIAVNWDKAMGEGKLASGIPISVGSPPREVTPAG